MEINNPADITKGLATGNEEVFRFLYEKYSPALRYFAHRYIEDSIPVSDIVQDTFIKLWESRNSFRDEKAIRAFLYKTARNLCLNQLRHLKVKDKYIHEQSHEDQTESFLENMMESELFGKIMEVFDQVPPACREVYRLSLDGKKHEEIANLLHLSIESVKKYKNRANHFMQEKLRILFENNLIF